MPLIADAAFDAALGYIITNGTTLHLCSAEPATFGGVAAVTLANRTSVTVGAAANGAVSGRRVTVPATTGGTVTGTGTATHYALVNTAGSILVAAGALASSQALTSGNTVATAAFDITFPDAVSA